MNRREIKITAKEAAKQAGKAAKLVTLVFLLIQLPPASHQFFDQPHLRRRKHQ